MKDKQSSESRRKLLKSIAAGSGAIVAGKSLPENWTKPVVDSVMLPAHAQTSPPPPPPSTFNYFGQNVPVVASIDSGTNFAELISDSLIHNAHAGKGAAPLVEMSAFVDGSTATVLFTPSRDPAPASGWALFQSNLPTDGTQGMVNLGPGGDCGNPWPDPNGGGPQAVTIIGYTSGDPTITIEITGGSGPGVVRSYNLPVGPGTATAVSCALQ